MVVAAALGLGLGMAGGVMLGGQLFKTVDLKEYRSLDKAADHDDTVPEPYPTGMIAPEMRTLLPYMPKWTTWPDFEQCRWLNSTIEWLWPHLCKAIHKMVKEILDPILTDVVNQQPMLEAITMELLDLGKFPMKLGGIKVYDTKDDEVILETPIMWGSDAKIHASARVRVGPVSIYVPLKVENVTMKATARITVRPLVETLPCLGAISISLTESPYVDLSLKAINNMDLMAVPFLHEAVTAVVQKVCEGICVYPNQIPIPLMPNSGLAKPPIGMLEINLDRIEDLKGSTDLLTSGDPYVKLSVVQLDDKGKIIKQGAEHHTAVKSGKKPKFNEHFKILLDDVGDRHKVMFEVYDYDLMGSDPLACVYYLDLDDSDTAEHRFIKEPSEAEDLKVSLKPPAEDGAGLIPQLGRLKTFGRKSKIDGSFGMMYMDVKYIPFFRAEVDVEENEKNPAKIMEMMQARAAPRKVNNDMKGVLVVNLMRCMDLPNPGSSCDSYVEIKLADPDANNADIRKSEVVLNEPSPRFRQKFEFVSISATSMLTVTVFNRKNALSMSNIMKLGHKSDTILGKLRISVKDVVKTSRMKDAFPLQEAEQGDVHMSLDWTPVERDDS